MRRPLGEYETNEIKSQLVAYLKSKNIDNVVSLWGETKGYCKSKAIEMGGSYASWGDRIHVRVNINKQKFADFNVYLKDVIAELQNHKDNVR